MLKTNSTIYIYKRNTVFGLVCVSVSLLTPFIDSLTEQVKKKKKSLKKDIGLRKQRSVACYCHCYCSAPTRLDRWRGGHREICFIFFI